MNIARRQFWIIAVTSCLLATFSIVCDAQDNPFGNGGDDPFGTAAPTTAPANDKPARQPSASADLMSIDRPDPVVDAILGSDPQTPLELVNAIDLLIDVNRADLAVDYLKKLNSLKLDDQKFYELYKQAGSAKIFRIATQPGLVPEGQLTAKKILDGAENFATDTARIEGLAETAIRDEDRYQRSVALSDLRLLGDTGAAALIEKLGDPAYKDAWPRIRQAVSLFGNAAAGPVSAGLRSNSLKLRLESLYLLRNIDTSDSVESLIGFMLSDSSTDLQKEVAAQSLKHLIGSAPDSVEGVHRLQRSAHKYLLDKVGIDQTGDTMVKWWLWNDQNKLEPTWVTAQTIARIRSFQRAEHLIEIDPDNREYQILYWLSRLEAAKLSGGQNRELLATTLQTFADTIDPAMARDVLDKAIQINALNAAVASCEILGAMGRQQFLMPDGAEDTSPLIKALNAGSTRLTAAATKAIGKIKPTQSFPGSSDYIRALVYLSRSSGLKTAVVGHADLEIAQSLAALINRQGFTARTVTTARDLFDVAQNDPDLELLVITDRVFRPNFSELVQALRTNSRTRQIPILLLVEPENLSRAERLAERYKNIQVSPMVLNEKVIARQLDNLESGVQFRDTNEVERSDNAIQALNQLDFYASQPEKYPFFDILSYEEDLTNGLTSPVRAAATCRVLGELGTADAQRRLVQIASNFELPVELRQAAVKSFAVAVQKCGLMLSRQQILNQYERYNASRDENEVSQQILGSLLDVLEGRTSSE